jgi:hypothetical protein
MSTGFDEVLERFRELATDERTKGALFLSAWSPNTF